MENILSGCRKGRHSSSVEAVDKGNDNVAFGILAVLVKAVFSCYFYSTLIGLGAAVAKEYLIIACGLTKLCGKVRLHLCVVVVRCVLNSVSLGTYGLDPLVITVAKAVGADTRTEIYVGLSVLVLGSPALALIEHKIETSVGRHNVLIEFLYRIHSIHFPPYYPYAPAPERLLKTFRRGIF